MRCEISNPDTNHFPCNEPTAITEACFCFWWCYSDIASGTLAAFFIFWTCAVVLPCRCQCWSITVLCTIIWLIFIWLQHCLFYITTLRYVITRSAKRMAIEAQWSKCWYHAWKLCCLNSWWCCGCDVHRSLWEKKVNAIMNMNGQMYAGSI